MGVTLNFSKHYTVNWEHEKWFFQNHDQLTAFTHGPVSRKQIMWTVPNSLSNKILLKIFIINFRNSFKFADTVQQLHSFGKAH